MKAEQLLLKSASTGDISEYFEEVCEHYGKDFNHARLRNQLAVVKDVVNSLSPSLQDIQEAVLSEYNFIPFLKTTATALYCSCIYRLSRAIIFFTPQTQNLSKMTAQRLNHMLLLHVHKSLSDQIDLTEVTRQFVTRNERKNKCLIHFNHLLLILCVQCA